jgi:hypothetical protein
MGQRQTHLPQALRAIATRYDQLAVPRNRPLLDQIYPRGLIKRNCVTNLRMAPVLFSATQ